MIDLHCHIVPGVDDGASTLEESLRMARLAVDSGVTVIAATPHCNLRDGFANFADEALSHRFGRLCRGLEQAHIPLQICAGMEVYATEELPRMLEDNALLTLGGSRYLLIEFGFGEPRSFADWALETVERFDLIPVVAHPERYYFVQDDPTVLQRWAEQGRVLQVNKGSFFGSFGKPAAKTAHWCLRTGCFHLVGSDAHSPYRRTTRMDDVYEFLADRTSAAVADFLLQDNPARILQDQSVVSVMDQF